MDENKNQPYAIRMTMAMLAGNPKLKSDILTECLTDMTHKMIEVAQSYDVLDMPFVICTMRTVSTALMSMLDDEGRRLAENLTKATSCVTINGDELRKQAQELDQEEK